MCTTCGCGSDGATVDGAGHQHHHDPVHGHRHDGSGWHVHEDGTAHRHDHHPGEAHHHHGHDGHDDHDHDARRIVRVEQDILAKNNAIAAGNRRRLADRGIFAVNLVSSPGSGKTTLLCRTIELLGAAQIAVIEGDQQTSNDAERIRATGATAVQVNTGKGCHLDAEMVSRAMDRLPLTQGSLLLVENVGNLVCPAEFDLGEAHKVVILSVTEGEDKPLKYPHMFRAADVMILNKVDLLPHVQFDVGAAVANARHIHPGIEVLQVSAATGAGMESWTAFLQAGMQRAAAARDDEVRILRERVAQLEAKLAG